MPTHVFSAEGWDETNTEPCMLPGHVKSRRSVFVTDTGRDVAFGGVFSIIPQQDDIARIYTVEQSSDTLTLYGYSEDDDFQCAQKELLASGSSPIVTWAVVDNIIFVSSPAFPTHYMLQGGGAWLALSEDIENVDGDVLFESMAFPRGICVEFGGRLAVASDNVLYFADAGRPFTFLASNALDPPGGSIRGLHVIGGALVACTATGVYALPQEAATRADVFGTWQRVSDFICTEYGQTVEHAGVLWGLTRNGLQAVYPSAGSVDFNQSFGQRTFGDRMSSQNWASDARLLSVPGEGVAVVPRGRDGFFFFRPEYKHGSWWVSETTPGWMNIRGAARLSDGSMRFYTANAVWSPVGNRQENETTFHAGLSGSIREHTVDRSPVLRKTQFAAGLGGDGSVFVSVRGQSDVDTDSPPARGLVAGTSVWGSGTSEELEVRSRRFFHSVRTDEPIVEFGVTKQDVFIRLDATADFKGISKRRPTD